MSKESRIRWFWRLLEIFGVLTEEKEEKKVEEKKE